MRWEYDDDENIPLIASRDNNEINSLMIAALPLILTMLQGM